MTTLAPIQPLVPPSSPDRSRYELERLSDDSLHAEVKLLTGRYNALTAELLAHLAEVDARGIYRERACSSLYTYCVYELRLSEDEAQRRSRAARTARQFPTLFEMLATGAIHMTGLLLLAPHLTLENHAELLARARFRTKREIERLVAEIAPRPDVPARVEPLGGCSTRGSSWQAYTASLRGAVRDIPSGVAPGHAPPPLRDAGARDVPTNDVAPANVAGERLPALRYRVEFTASERHVELLEEAQSLLQHRVPDRDVAQVHELALEALVEQLRRRRRAESSRRHRVGGGDAPAPPKRVLEENPDGSTPGRILEERPNGSAPERVLEKNPDGPAPERITMRGDRHRGTAVEDPESSTWSPIAATCLRRSSARFGAVTKLGALSWTRAGSAAASVRVWRFTMSTRLRSAERRRSGTFGSCVALTTRCSQSAISGGDTCRK